MTTPNIKNAYVLYNKAEQRKASLTEIKRLVAMHYSYQPPSYNQVVTGLIGIGLKTGWGNKWTERRLYRFLQRQGYSGLHGIKQEIDAG